jgi:hypothetical protein
MKCEKLKLIFASKTMATNCANYREFLQQKKNMEFFLLFKHWLGCLPLLKTVVGTSIHLKHILGVNSLHTYCG